MSADPHTSSESPGEVAGATPKLRPVYVRAVRGRMKGLLFAVFALVALLSANSAYLGAITGLEYATKQVYQNYFYQVMFLAHLVLGLVLVLPYLGFGGWHMVTSWNRKNKRAIRMGYALFAVGIVVLISGVLLMRVGGFDLKQPQARAVVYWAHVAAPFVCVWLYWLHRLVGPRIQWKVGAGFALATALVVGAMVGLHSQDPRQWNVSAPKSGDQYFQPSLARTSTGNFIPAETLMMDEYCLKCHQDAYKGWFHSSHHFSSFNNPAYLASVRETREVALKRDGSVQASRWCAGCHDPVPFLSGAFDDPKFDDVKHPTAHAGITCTVCHAITHVNSTKGNADFVIEEPTHYPFATSDSPLLQWVNETLVKAKPSFHKQTFLKEFHKTEEFCSTCHKVHLPKELTNYKEFLRGQNHYDTYLLSGASGHGARAFYYPETAFENCAACHMPLQPSTDFGARLFAGAKSPSIHDHFFPAANTGVVSLRPEDPAVRAEVIRRHQEFLQGITRVDIFGVKEGGGIDGRLVAPLRPTVPTLKPGSKYLLETVVRTLKIGHPLTQGTVDSNELWVDVTLRSGGRIVGRNGGIDAEGGVDPYAHFINVFMLDREGNRIDRRNPQDIFVPLYNKQVPPGAGAVVHYGFEVPPDLKEPLTVDVKLQYRKFDKTYMDYIAKNSRPGDVPIEGLTLGQPFRNTLPVTTMASDTLTFPVEGAVPLAGDKPHETKVPVWQRWNDYGIGLLLEGQNAGGKGELRQAAEVFAEVEKLGRYDGPLNLARVLFIEGRLDEATQALGRTAQFKEPPAPAWTVSWLSGLINRQQGHVDAAIENFKSVLEMRTAETVKRKFDFSRDYEVINELGLTLFERAKFERGDANKATRAQFLNAAVEQFRKTLALDSENVTAHYNLALLYDQLGDATKADEHRRLHLRYKPDDNARDEAIAKARKRYPAGNFAAEIIVIYPLQRDGAPELPVGPKVAQTVPEEGLRTKDNSEGGGE
jgi:tetratricopeptide (TPR) repeat protein